MGIETFTWGAVFEKGGFFAIIIVLLAMEWDRARRGGQSTVQAVGDQTKAIEILNASLSALQLLVTTNHEAMTNIIAAQVNHEKAVVEQFARLRELIAEAQKATTDQVIGLRELLVGLRVGGTKGADRA